MPSSWKSCKYSSTNGEHARKQNWSFFHHYWILIRKVYKQQFISGRYIISLHRLFNTSHNPSIYYIASLSRYKSIGLNQRKKKKHEDEREGAPPTSSWGHLLSAGRSLKLRPHLSRGSSYLRHHPLKARRHNEHAKAHLAILLQNERYSQGVWAGGF